MPAPSPAGAWTARSPADSPPRPAGERPAPDQAVHPVVRNAPAGDGPRPRSRLRRIVRRLLLLLAAGIGGAALTQALWLPPLLQLVLPPLAARAGLHLSLRVERAHLFRLEVRDLRLADTGSDGVFERLALQDARVEFAPGALLRADPWGALKALGLRGVDLRLDLTRGDGAQPFEATGFELPAHLPRIEIQDAALELRVDPERTMEARSLTLSVRTGGEGRLAARDLALRGPPGVEVGVRRGELRFAWDRARVRLDSLVLDGREHLGPSRVDLARVGLGEVQGDLDLRVLGGVLRVELELALLARGGAGELEARLVARELDLAELGSWIPPELAPLVGHLDLEGHALVPLDDPLRAAGRLALGGRGTGAAGALLDTLEGRVEFAAGRLAGGALQATRGANRLSVRELALPILDLDGPALLRAARAEVELELSEPDEVLGRLSLELPPELRPRVELAATLAEGRLELRRASWDAPGASVRMGAGRIDLTRPSEPEFDLDLSLAIADLERAAGPLLPVPLAGRLSGILLLRGRWPEISGELELDGADLRVDDLEIGRLDLGLAVRRGEVRVRRFLARSPAARLELGGRALLPPRGGFDFAGVELGDVLLDLEARDLAGLHAALPAGRLSLRLAAEGALAEPRTVFAGELALDAGLGGPALGWSGLSIAGTGSGRRLDFETLEARGAFGALELAARAELDARFVPRSIDLARFAARTPHGALALVAPTRLALEQGTLRVDDLELEGELGRLRADGTLDAGAGRFRLSTHDLDLVPLLGPFLPQGYGPGRLDAQVTVETGGDGLLLAGRGHLRALRVAAGPELELDWDVAQRAGRASGALLLAWPDGALRARADVPLEPLADEPLAGGELSVLLELGGGLAGLEPLLAALGLELGGALDARVELGGSWHATSAHVSLDGYLARLRGAGFELLAEPARVRADLSLGEPARPDRLELTAPGRFDLLAQGELGPALDLATLLDHGPGELWARVPRGHARLVVADVGEWVRALEAQGLERQLLRSGRIDLAVSAAGPLADLEPTFELDLTEAQVRLGAGLPPLRGVAATLRGTLDDIELTRLVGDLGGAELEAQGRISRSDRDAPYALDLRLEGDDLLLLRERGLQVRADANLRVQGYARQGLAIGGKLSLREGRFARNLDFLSFERDRRPAGARGLELFSLREPPLSELRFDVAVDSRGPFRIDNNAVRGGLRPALRLGGTGEVPVLSGSIFLDPTRVSLPSGTLRMDSGVIRFEEADPFVPRLALQGGMRLRGYDIQVTVQGPYDSPEVILSSSPPLSDRALAVLVLTGELPPDEAGTLGAAGAGRSVVMFLARDFLTRWFDDESVDDEGSLLDRFEIVTGRDVTRQGSETVDASFRIADRVLRSNDSLYLRGERDVYDEFNYGLRLLFRFR